MTTRAGSPAQEPQVPAVVYRDAEAVIDAAVRGDRDAVVGTFVKALDRAGAQGAYDVAVCLAATMLGGGTSGASPVGDYARLDYPEIDKADYDSRWVARFISAYASGDAPTGSALFAAALADGQLSQCMVTLAGSTVATLRSRWAPESS